MKPKLDKIVLSEVLEHISSELWEVNERAIKSGRATMQFSECEIEFAIETEGKAETGIKVYVVNLGGGVKRSETNRIKIKFGSIPNAPIVGQIIAPGPAPGPVRQAQKVDENPDKLE